APGVHPDDALLALVRLPVPVGHDAVPTHEFAPDIHHSGDVGLVHVVVPVDPEHHRTLLAQGVEHLLRAEGPAVLPHHTHALDGLGSGQHGGALVVLVAHEP